MQSHKEHFWETWSKSFHLHQIGRQGIRTEIKSQPYDGWMDGWMADWMHCEHP